MLGAFSQFFNPHMVNILESTESFLHNLRPKFTFSEWFPTAAQLVFCKPSAPDKSQLASGMQPIDLPKQHVQQSTAAPARASNEDLVKAPKISLQGLFTNLGIEQPSLDFLDGLHANLRTSHTVSGNPVRFTNKEIKIKADNEWQHAMSRRHKWLVTLITWPLLLKYGYLKNEGPDEKRGAPILVKSN